jgi:hypothetical protein
MRPGKSIFVYGFLLFFTATGSRAQYYSAEYINRSLTLRSDFPAKSVLVSNLLSDRVGDMSPVIGAANWIDSGRQLECRSLLAFNYEFLPKLIINDPSLINSAELVLFPLQVFFSENDRDKPRRFLVRRVLENWEDSATMWQNQPPADSDRQVLKLVRKKNIDKPVSIDVTRLVRDMIRYGNHGFLICPESPQPETMAMGQLFASPKIREEDLRPLLVINYRQLADPTLYMQSWMEQGLRNWQNINRTIREDLSRNNAGSQPVKEPVKTVPVKD